MNAGTPQEDVRKAMWCQHANAEYIEHKGETWNRCTDCGLLELWAGGQRIAQELPALDRLEQRLARLEGMRGQIRSGLTALATGGIEEVEFALEVQDALAADEEEAA